ncbi:hypothetical protein [Virgisporangium aurantiacum]|uniref:hypothetical protein n=1 Tax=Virgisporangium aurantiacum TaxID=175570 RepID=UPI001951A02F|nr:hypothetical protein [Virgisporangium aurantiacum]
MSALVSGLDAELRRLGYKDSTMVWYRGCWRRVERFFAARGVQEFSLDVAMAWVDAACGFFAKEQAGTLKPNDRVGGLRRARHVWRRRATGSPNGREPHGVTNAEGSLRVV